MLIGAQNLNKTGTRSGLTKCGNNFAHVLYCAVQYMQCNKLDNKKFRLVDELQSQFLGCSVTSDKHTCDLIDSEARRFNDFRSW